MQTNLVPTTVYLNEAQQKQIKLLSVTMKAPKAEVTRLIIDKGIAVIQNERGESAKALLSLAGLIPKGSGLPKDLSTRHNEYTWDE